MEGIWLLEPEKANLYNLYFSWFLAVVTPHTHTCMLLLHSDVPFSSNESIKEIRRMAVYKY